jgi:hypothetical protein
MRELHAAWHEHGGRHRRGHDAIGPADIRLARVHDSPTPEARDSPKLKMLLDPEARKAERLKYQQKVEATEAAYTAKHAKPGSGDRRQAPEQPGPQEARPEPAPPETRDKPASRIAERRDPLESQREEQRKPERSRLPSNEMSQAVAGVGVALSSVADALNVLPGRWDAVAASFLGAMVAGVAWGNKRWRDRHGNRPED